MPFRDTKFLPRIHRGEQVYLLLRRHWLILSLKAFFWFFLITVFLVGQALLKDFVPFFSSGWGNTIINIVTSSALILSLLGLMIVWTMYYLNVQLVTNRRIIDINQKSITHHQTTEFDLRKVQDVTTEIQGPIANLFDYGNVLVQTAGTEQNFRFDNVASPHQAAKTVLALSGRAAIGFRKALKKKSTILNLK